MDAVILGISGAIALLVIGLEIGLGWQRGVKSLSLPWRSLGLGLILTALVAAAVALTASSEQGFLWILVLVGGLGGVLLTGISPWGRSAQALAVLLASGGGFFLPQSADIVVPSLAAVGLGIGISGLPSLLIAPLAQGLGLLQGLSQAWILVAALTWGSRIAEGKNHWMMLLPFGLAALTLVAGTLGQLMEPTGSEPSPGGRQWLGRGAGVIGSGLLGLALIQNGFQQDYTYALCFAVGLGSALGLLGIERQLLATDPALPSQRLWRGVMSVVVVGAGGLLALRLGGSYGAAVIGIGLLAFAGRWGAMATLFLAVRPLVQSLLFQFDLNLTGVNITHAYTYAALYLGIGGVLLALGVTWVYAGSAPLLTAGGLTVGSVLVSGLVGYFLHLEPQAALLLGAIMVALVIAALEPALGLREQRLAWLGTQGLLLSMVATLTAIVTTSATEMGEIATRTERILVLGGVVVLLAVGIVGIALLGRRPPSPGQSPAN